MKHTAGLLILVLLCLAGQAQRRFPMERVRLGFKLDPVISVLKPQDPGADRTSSRLGLSYGLMADFLLNEEGNYAFATGLQITMGGSTLKYDAGKGVDRFRQYPAEYQLKLQHIEIPAAIKLKTNAYNGIAAWGQFGTYLGFPIRGRANVTSLDQRYEKENVLSDLNPINAGLLLGVGIEYPLGERLTAVIGLNYQNGFVDVTRNAKWDDGKVNLNSFSLRLGMYF